MSDPSALVAVQGLLLVALTLALGAFAERVEILSLAVADRLLGMSSPGARCVPAKPPPSIFRVGIGTR